MWKIATNICPFPRTHFLTTTVAPLWTLFDSKFEELDVKSLVRELFDSKNSFCMTNFSKGKFLAGCAMFWGECSSAEIDEILYKMRDKNSASFIEWIPDSIMSANSKVWGKEYHLSSCLLANTTSITEIFWRMQDSFIPMYKWKAFAHTYLE